MSELVVSMTDVLPLWVVQALLLEFDWFMVPILPWALHIMLSISSILVVLFLLTVRVLLRR